MMLDRYRVIFRRYNFYPDYIIKLTNGDVWIIEAKGGASASGTSVNIDSYVEQKFNALKEFAEKHSDIKFGFVRNFGVHFNLDYLLFFIFCCPSFSK